MLLPTDPSIATALDDAMSAPLREVFAVVRFDWARDNFATLTPYTDLSDMADDVMVDRSYQSTLPEGLNVISGFSSGALNMTLRGTIASGPQTAMQLFDLYDGNSALAAYNIIGTPVDIRWRVRTALGDVDTQGFSGHVRGFKLHRLTGEVELSAVDNYDLIGPSVSLNRWGVTTEDPNSRVWTDDPSRMGSLLPFYSALPIHARWVTEELTRQMGRSTTREARPDALTYHSLIASPLPSIGDISNSHMLTRWITTDGKWSSQDSAYIHAIDTLNGFPTMGGGRTWCATDRTVLVPTGSGNPDQEIACVFNFYKPTALTGATVLFQSSFYLDDWRYNNMYLVAAESPYAASGKCTVQVLTDGTIKVVINETTTMSGYRTWTFTATTNIAVNAAAFQELWVKVKFSSNMRPTGYLNGTLLSWTQTGSADAYYRYRTVDFSSNADLGKAGGIPSSGRTNAVVIESNNTGGGVPLTFGVEWFGGNNTVLTYDFKPSRPSRPNGAPRVKYWAGITPGFMRGALKGLIYNFPEVDGADGLAALQDVVSAECGTLWTDEYGTLNIADASWQIPPTPTDPSLYLHLTDDQIADLVINPTDDNRRNAISYNGTFKGTKLGWVYEQQDALSKFIDTATPSRSFSKFAPTSALQINASMIADSAVTPDATHPKDINPNVSHVSAMLANGDAPASTWNYSITPVNRGRGYLEAVTNPTVFGLPVAFYVGTYTDFQTANLRIAGLLESEEQVVNYKQSNSLGVATYGKRNLVLDTAPWRQSAATAHLVSNALLATLSDPAPQVENLTLPGDPRRQLWDTAYVDVGTNQEVSGKFFGQVLSKTTRWSRREFTDTLGLRVLGDPGSARWGIGIWNQSTWTT